MLDDLGSFGSFDLKEPTQLDRVLVHTGMLYPHPVEAYQPPLWTRDVLTNCPLHGRIRLANLPTPVYPLVCDPLSLWKELNEPTTSTLDESLPSTAWFIKRDDCTSGVELGGNKIRKLEFLLADAVATDCTALVTIGGVQSNHCRATAAAARMVGLEPHLILRTTRSKSSSRRESQRQDSTRGRDSTSEAADIASLNSDSNKDPLGWTGNLLVDRMVGSLLYTCTPGEYARCGSTELVARLCVQLQTKCRPYPIPVGGSNGLGSWGYIEAVAELLEQWPRVRMPLPRHSADATDPASITSSPALNHIVVACGSGGTAAGIALGIALAYANGNVAPPTVHAVAVCDDQDYFYRTVASIADEMGLIVPRSDKDAEKQAATTEEFVRRHLVVHQGKGLGYASSTPDELAFVRKFASHTGVVLDPVYTGKALYTFVKYVHANPELFDGHGILFWHTGGALGLYDKGPDLEPYFTAESPCQRLNLYGGEHGGVDVSG